MIRLSCESDIKSIVSLWNEAFGDGENEIMYFIKNRYKPENTVVCEENGSIVSMLFLLDGQMRIKGTDYPSYYLYAACTSKEFRGRGLMASLLEFAKSISQKRGYRFICLKPAEESLFDFYKKHGYETVFSQKLLKVSKSDLSGHTDTINFDTAECYRSRNSAYKDFDYFKWDENAVKFAFNQNKLYNGKSLIGCEGYALYSQNNSTLYVKEMTFSPRYALNVLSYMVNKNNATEINVILPEKYETSIGSYEIMPSGMALPLDSEAKSTLMQLSGAYLGLTLD